MSTKKPKDADENEWRTSIEQGVLQSETWRLKVILIDPAGSDQDRLYLEKFESFASQEKRFVIKNISKVETFFMINQLGNEKKVKDGNFKVFEEAQKYLSEKKVIPSEIVALIIKRLILQMKEDSLFIQRQKLHVKEGIRRESATMINKTEVRGTVYPQSAGAPEPPPPTSPPHKGKGKKGEPEPSELPIPDDKKYNTSLRTRGEEWRDKVYVEDFPQDGPKLYVAVTGFVDPYLPTALTKIGIPLTAVVQLRINVGTQSIPSSLIMKSTRRGQSQTELQTEMTLKYWQDLQALRTHPDYVDSFVDTAFIVFSPPYSNSEGLSGDPEQIYDELCYLMYDIQDLSRQHLHYLTNMNIIDIPMLKSDERYTNYYHEMIGDIPLECTTIYSILDSMLETVCKIESEQLTSRSTTSTNVPMNRFNNPSPSKHEETRAAKTENLIKNIIGTLCKTETNKKCYRLTYGEEYETYPKDPILVNYGDFAKYNTFHLGNINLDNIVFSSLLRMPINNLWLCQDYLTEEFQAKINYHVNALLSCFDRADIETSELNRLLHILSCRKLYNNRSSLKKEHLLPSTISEFKKNYLKRSVLVEPLQKWTSLVRNSSTPSFPSISKIEFTSPSPSKSALESQNSNLFECPDISELVSAAEIANFQPMSHMIDDFDYFEDFFGQNAFQIMFDAFTKFNCVDYKYCEVTDCLILMYFNNHDKDGIAREEWRSHIATPVCLEDFFDFILDEHYDWIKKEEKMYDDDMTIKAQSESRHYIDPNSLKTCLGDMNVEKDLLMEGSLKYHDIKKEEENDTEDGIPHSDTKSYTKSVNNVSGVDTKSSKSGKSKGSASPKTKMIIIKNTESDESLAFVPKEFTGYDLVNRRVEVFGKDATFYSKDGTKVSSYYTTIIPMNLEYIILNVIPGNSNNEFWIHKALGERVSQVIKETCDSFRISSRDQVIVNIKKQTYLVPISLDSEISNFNTHKKSTVNEDKHKKSTAKDDNHKKSMVSEDTDAQQYETFYYSCIVTWPNGMITESIYENNSATISHIKQYCLNSKPEHDEEMRCITLNGEVLIFKKSGDIEVLKPDGSYICITKYAKHVLVPPNPDEQPSEEVTAKGKKTKHKLKVKNSKSSSHSSKHGMEEDKISLSKLEYELIIEEFEIIEANGLRQKWINNTPFDIEKLLMRTATDFCLGEVFTRRMDGCSILLNKDGILIVTFPNKTRIITYYEIEDDEILPEWTEEEKEYFKLLDTTNTIEVVSTPSHPSQSSVGFTNDAESSSCYSSKRLEEDERIESEGYVSVQLTYIVEHEHFSTITINKVNDKILIDSPNETTIIIDQNNHYEIKLDTDTTAKFNGENLDISYRACPECKSFTTCNIKISQHEEAEETNISPWLKMKDSYCKQIHVDDEGSINLFEDISCSETIVNTDESPKSDTDVVLRETIDEKTIEIKSESSFISHGRCREKYLAKTIRFFVLKRDLSCAELVHKELLNQYKLKCRWQPWCSINRYNTFDDNRSYVTILSPIHLTEPEKWLMNSKFADKPKYLTYKDLKIDSGKGFYHWMRPYERFVPMPTKPQSVLPPRLPRAFVLRTLEQQWTESNRENLKGARELVIAILRYRCLMDTDRNTINDIPIMDLRTPDEVRIDVIIQTLAHRAFTDLRTRLSEDIQNKARVDITTTRAPEPQMSYEGQDDEALSDSDYSKEFKLIEEEREEELKQADATDEMSPNLQRYWRRRAEEYKEEKFFTYLLRENSVPPYFRNVLGGAIWWDINNLTGEAITKAERRKMKCVCAENAQAECNQEHSKPSE